MTYTQQIAAYRHRLALMRATRTVSAELRPLLLKIIRGIQ